MDWKYIAENVQFVNFWAALWLPLSLIALDFATGFVGACIRGERSSHIMLVGGGHKFAEIICISVALLLDGFLVLPMKLVYFVSIYIILMELVSIGENVKKLGLRFKKPDEMIDNLEDELFGDDEDKDE